jgi:hypothetical protein
VGRVRHRTRAASIPRSLLDKVPLLVVFFAGTSSQPSRDQLTTFQGPAHNLPGTSSQPSKDQMTALPGNSPHPPRHLLPPPPPLAAPGGSNATCQTPPGRPPPGRSLRPPHAWLPNAMSTSQRVTIAFFRGKYTTTRRPTRPAPPSSHVTCAVHHATAGGAGGNGQRVRGWQGQGEGEGEGSQSTAQHAARGKGWGLSLRWPSSRH